MIDAFREHSPPTLKFVSQAVRHATNDLSFLRLAPEPWSKLEDISIDYAIMEKAKNLVAVRYGSNGLTWEGGTQSGQNVSQTRREMWNLKLRMC